MEKAGRNKRWGLLMVWFLLIVQLFLLAQSSVETPTSTPEDMERQELIVKSQPPLRLHRLDDDHVVMDNGIVKATLSTPQGMITEIQYNGIRNIMELNKEKNRGYWDIVWNRPGYHQLDELEGTSCRVIREDENQIEISFVSQWNSSLDDTGRPLNVDKRFVMLRGSSGFYSYAKFERMEGWPGMTVAQARIAFKLNHRMFNYMAISDTRQRFMPSANDRSRGRALDYPEAVLLIHPQNEDLRGQVDDKYQYSADIKNNRVHGWISHDPAMGFWVITPSNEFRIGGPLKQELTSHVGPTSLAMFFSNHYAGTLSPQFQDGEPWNKVFGPVFIYLNKASTNETPITTLWKDAKQQMLKESENWPYSFPLMKDFHHSDQRGTVRGQLLVRDRYINKELFSARSAYVGLAKPGGVTSWQYENKGYQFWTKADAGGNFVIKNVRAGHYNLYAWVPGIIGDYRCDVHIKVNPGSEIRLGDLVYDPPRSGPTLWEIGIPDRTAAEFHVPDPDPKLVNPLFIHQTDKFRQYGLWDRYSDLYPKHDLIYSVDKSNYQKDWFFAHVNRKTENNTYVPTTWRISFNLRNFRMGIYTLQLALASSSTAELQVRINNPLRAHPHFTTGLIGKDNAIARHGIHGLYSLYSVRIPGSQLVRGSNSIYLTQSRGGGPFRGLMYDYLRLEGPPQTT